MQLRQLLGWVLLSRTAAERALSLLKEVELGLHLLIEGYEAAGEVPSRLQASGVQHTVHLI